MSRELRPERQRAWIAVLVVAFGGAALYLSLSAPASPSEATPATVNPAFVDVELPTGVEAIDTTDAAAATHAASGSANVEPQQTGRRPPLRVVLISDTHGLYQHKDLIKVPPGTLTVSSRSVCPGWGQGCCLLPGSMLLPAVTVPCTCHVRASAWHGDWR